MDGILHVTSATFPRTTMRLVLAVLLYNCFNLSNETPCFDATILEFYECSSELLFYSWTNPRPLNEFNTSWNSLLSDTITATTASIFRTQHLLQFFGHNICFNFSDTTSASIFRTQHLLQFFGHNICFNLSDMVVNFFDCLQRILPCSVPASVDSCFIVVQCFVSNYVATVLLTLQASSTMNNELVSLLNDAFTTTWISTMLCDANTGLWIPHLPVATLLFLHCNLSSF